MQNPDISHVMAMILRFQKTTLLTRFIMKKFILTALMNFCFLISNHAQTYQDTTFTETVFISYADDLVRFENCRFVGIQSVALLIEGSEVLVSNCTFNDIYGTAVFAYDSDVYLVEDTIQNVGIGIYAEFGSAIIQRCQISQTSGAAVRLTSIDVGEINECSIHDVGSGIFCDGVVGSSELLVVKNDIRRVNGVGSVPEVGFAVFAEKFLTVKVIDCRIDSCVASGIYFRGGNNTPIDTAELRNNIISRTNFDGINGRARVMHAIIQNNEVSYPGFLGGDSSNSIHCINWLGPNALIEGNHLHHTLDTACISNNCGSGIYIQSSATITRNLIHNCAGYGIQCIFGEGPTSNQPLSIFNNIIYDIEEFPVLYIGDFQASYNEPILTQIKNNTLHSSKNPLLDICCQNRPISVEGNILIFEGEVDTNKYIQAFSGFLFSEKLNLKAPGDLDFVDFAGRDFHLASENSPAHNFLPLNFGLPNDDFDGDLRLGLRDAGADELASDKVICGCNNCPSAIPENFYTDLAFTVVSAEKNDLSSTQQGVCSVRVDFEHEYIGDITMNLISPAGQSVQLVGPSGFWGYTDFTKWNVGFVPCVDAASPDPGFSEVWNNNQVWGESGFYSGIYYPASGCLEDFNLGTVTGDWILRVSDNQANDVGLVQSFEVLFCDTSGVSCFGCSEPPTTFFSVIPVGGWAVSISNQSTGGVTDLLIDFGDGQTESGLFSQTFHEYENPGVYVILLIATNECGVDTFSRMLQIAGVLPTAFVTAEPMEGCSPLELQTIIISVDHVDSWHWLFPGGVPSESFEMEPSVTYAIPGTYFATLIIENEVGSITIDSIFSVNAQPGLFNPSFEAQIIGDSIICTNTTQNALSYYWTINGGAPVGMNTSPFVFEVDTTGIYTVGFEVVGLCDTVSLTEQIPVIISSSKNLKMEDWRFSISPNPNDGSFRLSIDANENLSADLSILNALGLFVMTQKIDLAKGKNHFDFNFRSLSSGVYYLQVQTAIGLANLSILITY